MHGREGLQALQARLGAARAAADRGDRDAALVQIAAALELDPNFLAAHALRDRLLADASAPVPAPVADERAPAPPPQDVSADGYARFQQRTKRRRLENRVDAARDAITRGRLTDAAAALDEVIELDPKLPELFALTEAFDTLRRRSPAHRGPWLAAAAVFACTILGGSWLHDSSSLTSRPVMTAGILLPVAVPKVTISTEVTPIGTSGEQKIEASGAKAEITPEPAGVPLAPEPPSETAAQPSRSPQDVAADESALIQKALQRYQLAYEKLDALPAQALAFDACDVRVSGDIATATCQGSPRVWIFTLRKNGGDWTVDTARAER
jgi:tetratricopeptide (TPR) repeat protein